MESYSRRALRKVGKIAYRVIIGTTIYTALMMGTQFVSSALSNKIESQQQLERLLREKRKEIAPNNSAVIDAELSDDPDIPSYSYKNGDGSYGIVLSKHWHNESTLEHELYHILDGHLDGSRRTRNGRFVTQDGLPGFLKYFFWYEPQATIYEATGLKL